MTAWLLVAFLLGATAQEAAVRLLAWSDKRRDDRCIGDLPGEGLSPTPTTLPAACRAIDHQIESALEEGYHGHRIDPWELENGWRAER